MKQCNCCGRYIEAGDEAYTYLGKHYCDERCLVQELLWLSVVDRLIVKEGCDI